LTIQVHHSTDKVFDLRAASLPRQDAAEGEQEAKTVWVEVLQMFPPMLEEGLGSMAVVFPNQIPVLAEVDPALPAVYLPMVVQVDSEEVVQAETLRAAEVVSSRLRFLLQVIDDCRWIQWRRGRWRWIRSSRWRWGKLCFLVL
jgi:hypothetical protein